MSTHYRIVCFSKAMSPITHASGVAGNEAVVMREPVVCEAGKRFVPVLSGNALRHRLIREPGARHLIESWGLAGKLSLEQLNLLFHGGNLTDKGGREATAMVAQVYRVFPLLALLGAATPKQILPGNLLCWRGLLVCRENASRIARRVPTEWLNGEADTLRSAADFVDGYQYTRSDVRQGQVDLVREEETEGESNLMIFAGQQVVTGACFLHGFDVRHAKPIEMGCLLLALRLWAVAGATIGGQSSRGHGRLDMSLLIEPAVEQEACITEYLTHVASAKEEALDVLRGLFAREEKPKRGKKQQQELPDADADTD